MLTTKIDLLSIFLTKSFTIALIAFVI